MTKLNVEEVDYRGATAPKNVLNSKVINFIYSILLITWVKITEKTKVYYGTKTMFLFSLFFCISVIYLTVWVPTSLPVLAIFSSLNAHIDVTLYSPSDVEN